MKHSLLAVMALLLAIPARLMAQAPTQTTSPGVMSRPAGQAPATGSTAGMQRKGSGKMASGVTRNGNSNLSPTGPTNTQGSTSDGSASKPSAGGAPGTNTRETRPPATANNTRATRSAAGTKNASATSAGPASTRPGDAMNNTQNPPKMSPTATKGSVRNTQNAQTSTVSTSGKTGSRRPSSQAQVQQEARTSDELSATGYPSPTGVGKPGTPAGTAKGKTGNTNARSYPQPNKTGNN